MKESPAKASCARMYLASIVSTRCRIRGTSVRPLRSASLNHDDGLTNPVSTHADYQPCHWKTPSKIPGTTAFRLFICATRCGPNAYPTPPTTSVPLKYICPIAHVRVL